MTREEARKAIEVMQAYADGKEIEFDYGKRWETTSDPSFNWSVHVFRIKPEPEQRLSFGTLGSDLTEAEKDALREAYKRGKLVEYTRPELSVWCPISKGYDTLSFKNDFYYRVKPESPKKKFVPWTAETCPLKCGDVVKEKDGSAKRMVIAIDKFIHLGVLIAGINKWLFETDLLGGYLFNGKPCGEEVEE